MLIDKNAQRLITIYCWRANSNSNFSSCSALKIVRTLLVLGDEESDMVLIVVEEEAPPAGNNAVVC